ncbi:unnamed protein product [Symbiodinium necroappetens]|uniref:Uncharacterized protein n=1 Tax=Symbiodinium necroappetens TaxID=1628268 RepID=A0A813B9K5_9DINO|nr:unnamed protein product [Symbiodinium necroappetens]
MLSTMVSEHDRVNAVFSEYLKLLESDTRCRSRSPAQEHKAESPLPAGLDDYPLSGVPETMSPSSMKLGILALVRLYKGEMSDDEAVKVAKEILGGEEAPSQSCALTPPLKSQPDHASSACPDMVPKSDAGAKESSRFTLEMAFSQTQVDAARTAIRELKNAIKEVDTSTGARTIQVTFRRGFDPVEVAQRVEYWRGPCCEPIPVEPLEIKRHGTFRKPVGPQSFAVAGGDARKFVLKLQLAGTGGQSTAKVRKLSLQVKTSSKELWVLGSKTVLSDEAASMIMHFGPHDSAQVLAGSTPKFDVSLFFATASPNV